MLRLLKNSIERGWYSGHPALYLLLPFSFIFWIISSVRRWLYRVGFLRVNCFDVPVIVVGNITVGGVGKTPFVIALVNALKEKGYRPGVVSRGYGGSAKDYPRSVLPESDAQQVGDEPVLIAQRTGRPVFVDPKRVRAVRALLAQTDCDVVVSDDGLQHYALGRDVEVAMVDAKRQLGNGFCLPAGPLRELRSRLLAVDWVVTGCEAPASSVVKKWGGGISRSATMHLKINKIYSLVDKKHEFDFQSASTHSIRAVAGIGHPDRFFKQLEQRGFSIIRHAFPDHHVFSFEDIDFGKDDIIIMTEKDAVKCRAFADERHWSLSVDAVITPEMLETLIDNLKPADVVRSVNVGANAETSVEVTSSP